MKAGRRVSAEALCCLVDQLKHRRPLTAPFALKLEITVVSKFGLRFICQQSACGVRLTALPVFRAMGQPFQ